MPQTKISISEQTVPQYKEYESFIHLALGFQYQYIQYMEKECFENPDINMIPKYPKFDVLLNHKPYNLHHVLYLEIIGPMSYDSITSSPGLPTDQSALS